MDSDDWSDLVQTAITKSGLPYLVVSCRCRPGSLTCFATIEHQRTRAKRQVALSPGMFPPDEARNEVVYQIRSFNVQVPTSCPKGHWSLTAFERDELRRLLADGTLTLYCDVCDEFREPKAGELAAIEQLLAERSAA